jgi:TonB family protein
MRSLTRVQFATPKLGFAIGEGGYAITQDGGSSWKFADVNTSSGLPVQAIAVRDALHAAILRNADTGRAQELVTTDDGGRHFCQFKSPQQYNWMALRATDSGFEVYGDRRSGSADPTPAAAVYSEGAGWHIAPDPPAGFRHCNPQGCLVDGGWVEFTGSQAHYWGRTDDEAQPLVRSWAVTGDTFCDVSEELRCRAGRGAWQKPDPTPPDKDVRPAQCLNCKHPAYPLNARDMNQQGRVVIDIMISPEGVPFDLVIASAASAELAASALTAVRAWRYQPMVVDGKPMAATTTVTVGYALGQVPWGF